MKIELKSREGSVYKKLCSSVAEANSDAELIVPDSLEDILRILSCRHQCRIREKNVSQDAVSVSGEIDVTVMYIPETGDGVRVVGTTVPFESSYKIPTAGSRQHQLCRHKASCTHCRCQGGKPEENINYHKHRYGA